VAVERPSCIRTAVGEPKARVVLMAMHAGSPIASASYLIGRAKRVVVLTGAGISTDSGIPDFRGPNGVWTRNPAAEKASTLSHYLNDPEVRRAAWQSRIHSPAWAAEPNDGHRAIVALERRGKLHTLVTQNIDELHQRAGSDPERVVEVHGTMRRYHCWGCDDSGPMQVMLDRVRAGEDDPACLVCGGIVKSATISFGQALTPGVIERAFAAAADCDVLLAIGTTLQVYPVANLVPIAARARATIIIVNADPTAMDHHADFVLRGSASEILPTLLGEDTEVRRSVPSITEARSECYPAARIARDRHTS
jgi:NAD-dependent deacetylase